MKINMGCGRHTLPGWFCIDAVQHPRATRPLDLVSDVKDVDLPDQCATELMAIHLFEHLYRWECDATIAEWRRLLKPGGRLVLEMPDIVKCCRNLVEGFEQGHPGQMSYWGLYGDPRLEDPFMCHRWGWTFATLAPFLQEHGFKDVAEETPQWHPGGRHVRDFRVVAVKC